MKLIALLLVGLSFTAQAGFVVEKHAEGVYVALRTEPPGLMFDANVVFIVNDEDVVVGDAILTPSSARETIAALRKITKRPVRYLVNTHWHIDHVSGNATWREAYPGVEFIGHASAREDMLKTGEANKKAYLEGAPGFAAKLRESVAKGESLAGKALTGEEREAYLADAALVESYVREAPAIELVPPTIAIDGRLTLRRGERVIDIRYLGAGHSRADLVVHLPNEGILVTGDLVVWPVPLVGSTSFPAEYAATLGRLLELKPRLIIPGHGNVLRSDDYVWSTMRMLEAMASQAAAAVARGETLEQARRSVHLEKFRAAIAGDSPQRNLIFRSYVVQPGVEAAYNEAKAKLQR
jgi:cyclase